VLIRTDSTEKMIDRLILYMVNLGLLTSVASLLTLILVRSFSRVSSRISNSGLTRLQFLVLPQSFAFVSLTLIRSKRESLSNYLV
jgi:hypothetical protein